MQLYLLNRYVRSTLQLIFQRLPVIQFLLTRQGNEKNPYSHPKKNVYIFIAVSRKDFNALEIWFSTVFTEICNSSLKST